MPVCYMNTRLKIDILDPYPLTEFSYVVKYYFNILKNLVMVKNHTTPSPPPPLVLTFIGITVSTSPSPRLAPRGSKLTTKSMISCSGAPGRLYTGSSSTLKPCWLRCDRSARKDAGNHPVLVARTILVRTVPSTTCPKSNL